MSPSADYYGVTQRLRPLTNWPGTQTVDRERHPFRTGSRWGTKDDGSYGVTKQGREVPYSETETLLAKEVLALGATEYVLQVDVPERGIRVDGSLAANARLRSPAVVVTIVIPGRGTLTFPSDRFTDWKANVRAIALTLEALRKIDRYGTTPNDEQYVGWKEIGSGRPMSAADVAEEEISIEQAGRVVAGWISGPGDLARNGRTCVEDPDYRKYAYRMAWKALHPDAGGGDVDLAAAARLTRAKQILDENDGVS